MKEIDIEKWNRKEHFEFFSKMASPYFGIITELDCSNAYKKNSRKWTIIFLILSSQIYDCGKFSRRVEIKNRRK